MSLARSIGRRKGEQAPRTVTGALRATLVRQATADPGQIHQRPSIVGNRVRALTGPVENRVHKCQRAPDHPRETYTRASLTSEIRGFPTPP